MRELYILYSSLHVSTSLPPRLLLRQISATIFAIVKRIRYHHHEWYVIVNQLLLLLLTAYRVSITIASSPETPQKCICSPKPNSRISVTFWILNGRQTQGAPVHCTSALYTTDDPQDSRRPHGEA